jgi:hypothetical protein
MIQLSGSPNLQVQVGEAIAVMAEWDFPLQWGDLVNVSCFHAHRLSCLLIHSCIHACKHDHTIGLRNSFSNSSPISVKITSLSTMQYYRLLMRSLEGVSIPLALLCYTGSCHI